MADHAPWTIKAVPVETRQLAVKAAKAQGLTVGKWVIRAVERVADLEALGEAVPPERPQHPSLPNIDIAGFAAAITASMNAIQAVGDQPSKAFANEVLATVRLFAKAIRESLDDRPYS